MNSVRDLAHAAFSGAAPYLQHAEWIREVFDAILEKAESFEQMEQMLKEEIVRQNDVTKKADLKIYLTYLGKTWRKHVG